MNNIIIISITLFLGLMNFTWHNSVQGQDLPRRAYFEASISYPSTNAPGAVIQKVHPDSPLGMAGVKAKDVIIEVNNRKIITQEDMSYTFSSIRSGELTTVKIIRGNKMFEVSVELPPYSLEEHKGIETIYGHIVNDSGMRQRTIITKPHKKNKLPAIMLLQGLSCSSIEKYSEKSNNWIRLINDLVEKSGMVVMRVEKPGVGDSEGDCGEVDFETELSGYAGAIEKLKSLPYVDSSKVIIYGNSMGSMLAPYFAKKFNLAGIISDGTFFKSWYEHMLEIERRILEIEGKTQSEIYTLINTVYIPLYYEMLIKKRTFEEILKEYPTYKAYHRQGLNHMYGRSMKYYHQLQDFNIGEAWSELTIPVRIRWGTNDWIMSEFDNDMIQKVILNSGNSNIEVFKYDGLDHWATIHPDYKSSFNFEEGEWEEKISQQIIDWAWEIVE